MDIKRLLGSKNLIFYSGIILIFILVFLRLILGVNIPIYINLILFGLIAIFSDRQQLVTLAIVCLPLSATFQYKYALLICVVVYFFKFNEDITIKRVIIPVLLMMFWEAIHLFWYEVELKEYFRSFSELIVVVFVMLIPLKKFNYTKFIRVFAVSCIIMFSIMLLYLLKENNFSFEEVFKYEYRFGVIDRSNQNFSANLNPNSLGFLCNLSIVGLAQLLLSRNGKIIDGIFIAILIMFGFMTMSRTFLLNLAVITVICLILIVLKFTAKTRWIVLGGVIITGIIAIIFLYLLFPFVVEEFIERFSDADISNGRIDIFKFYNKHILSNPKYLFFGIGLQNVTKKVTGITGIYSLAPHNGIQELLVVWGIPGLALFTWFIVEMFLQSKRLHKIKLINVMPAVLVLINIMLGQFVRSGIIMLSLLLVYVSLYVKFDVVGEYIEDDKCKPKRTFISKTINYIKHPTKILRFLNLYGFGWLFSDKFCIKFTYYERMGIWPNLDNPKTFTEKLNWIKLNDRNPIYTTMVDKIKVKDFVSSRIGEEYVLPLLGVWDNPEDINFDLLPDKFVLKCNHNSSTGMCICTDKSKLNIDKVVSGLKKGLKVNYYYYSREWPYKDVEKKVFAETLLTDDENPNVSINDYKFFCFDGEPKIMFIATDRNIDCRFDFFNMDFERLNIQNIYPQSDKVFKKPKMFEEMKEIAKKLSKGFKVVRVDLYEVGGKIYFGEYTFFHGGAFSKFYPNEWDEKLGSWIKLPIDAK